MKNKSFEEKTVEEERKRSATSFFNIMAMGLKFVNIISPQYENKGKKRKCAIYNRWHCNNPEKLEEERNGLITYCKEVLCIDDYVYFEDVGLTLDERKDYDEMNRRIHSKEFTDLLVINPNRLWREDGKDNKTIGENIIEFSKYIEKMYTVIDYTMSKNV